MTEMQYDEDSFLDVKTHMPELATIREGDPADKLKKTVIYILSDNNQVIDLFEMLLEWLGPTGFSRYVQYCHSNSSTAHRKIEEEGFRDNVYRVLVVTDTPDVVSDVRDIERMILVGAGYNAQDCVRRMNCAGRDGRQAEAVVLIEKGIIGSK